MPCEKYSTRLNDWAMDAALGALSAEREAEFRTHIEECASCREAFEHARAVSAAIDRGVESIVAAAPSAHFDSHLRARLAAERRPSRTVQLWPAWAPAAAVLAAAALLLFATVLRSTHRTSPRDATPTVASRPQPSATPPSAVAVNSASQSSPLQSTPARSSPARSPRHADAARASVQPPARPAEPEVLVEPGQFAAIEAYAEVLKSGRIDGKKMLAAQQQLENPLEIKPLEFAPLQKPIADPADAPAIDSSRP